MVHRLPKATTVDRDEFLVDAARGRRTVHVGFTDDGVRSLVQRDGTWLHARLAAVAGSLVGVDIDDAGVEEARYQGYEAYRADCCDPAELDQLGIEPAELLVAGEVIEHVDSVGSFLDGLAKLVAPGGKMILTTPNACRLTNVVASLAGIEVVHPDHVAWYSWYTLRNVLERHNWAVEEFHTYLLPPRQVSAPVSSSGGGELVARAGRIVLRVERVLARSVAPFLADGLIAVCRVVDPDRSRSTG